MELAFIDQLRRRLSAHPQLLLGVGDDAAVLRLGERADCVVTTDLLAEGTHFILSEAGPQRVGRKALAVNLSDLAAMAARPVAAVVSLLLPQEDAMEIACGLYDGMLPLAEEFHTAIAGGDTNCWRGPLVICVTAIGETTPRGPLRRDGARPGDAVLVTGPLGGSRLGKQFDFTPQIALALELQEKFDLHAGMDISDGLSLDLWRMCEASGCGAVLELDSIPISQAAHELSARESKGITALEHALADGEDFELLLAASPSTADGIQAQYALTRIGELVPERGLWSRGASGALIPLTPRGFEHGK